MAEKRGRPKTHGAQPGWMLARIMALVDQYNAGREGGLKESEALRGAVVSIREQFPDMRISEGAARRILAEWQSKNKMSLLITRAKQGDKPELRTLPDGTFPDPTTVKKGPEFGFGPRRQYPRTNAKDPSGPKTKTC